MQDVQFSSTFSLGMEAFEKIEKWELEKRHKNQITIFIELEKKNFTTSEFKSLKEKLPKEILERKRRLIRIRQVAMELCYRYCPLTQRDIGDLFGVDYSTVSQNRKRLKIRMESDKKLKAQFERLERGIEKLSKQNGLLPK